MFIAASAITAGAPVLVRAAPTFCAPATAVAVAVVTGCLTVFTVISLIDDALSFTDVNVSLALSANEGFAAFAASFAAAFSALAVAFAAFVASFAAFDESIES